jgi:hypothetical protein
MGRQIFLAFALCVIGNLNLADAQEVDQKRHDVNPNTQDQLNGEIERLIDRLASKNPMPKKGSKELSPHEKRIWKSVDELHQFGVRAFPQLIAHFDDARFSFSEDSLSSKAVHHHSVGYLCHEIVDSQVTKYVSWAVGDPRGSPGYGRGIFPRNKKDAEAWWQSNRNKELWELQVANLRFVIAENQELLKSEADARRRKLCEEAIAANERLASEITKDKSPLPSKPFRPYVGR